MVQVPTIQLALPRPHPKARELKSNYAASVVTGGNEAIIEALPELEYFRDIIKNFWINWNTTF